MKLNERQKMCTHCEGRIALDATLCPYCATEQGAGQFLQHKSIQESLTSLYPPPYGAKQNKSSAPTQEPMSESKFHHTVANSSQQQIPLEKNTPIPLEEKNSFWPLLLLSAGANLLVIGLLQLFFSDKGLLTLQWNSHYWFAYCLAALPLVYLGIKKANI